MLMSWLIETENRETSSPQSNPAYLCKLVSYYYFCFFTRATQTSLCTHQAQTSLPKETILPFRLTDLLSETLLAQGVSTSKHSLRCSFIFYICVVIGFFAPTTRPQSLWEKDQFYVSHHFFPATAVQSLAHQRHLINIYWLNKWMKKLTFEKEIFWSPL